jgi:hypothetical protein
LFQNTFPAGPGYSGAQTKQLSDVQNWVSWYTSWYISPNIGIGEKRELRMTVLASKQRYCINKDVLAHSDVKVEDVCHDMLILNESRNSNISNFESVLNEGDENYSPNCLLFSCLLQRLSLFEK